MNPGTLWFEFVEESDHIFEASSSSPKEEKKNAAFQMRGEGKTYQDIAETLGVNKSTVSRWFKEKT